VANKQTSLPVNLLVSFTKPEKTLFNFADI